MPVGVQKVTDDPETRELFLEKWPKVCACGCAITEDQWEKLNYVGIQKVPTEYGIPDMELRNCGRCGSTIAVVVPGDFI
jgi:hypothetical protein